ncbi:hypothetical protein YC2023_002757 [Brassica napus]
MPAPSVSGFASPASGFCRRCERFLSPVFVNSLSSAELRAILIGSGVWDGGLPFDGCLLTCSAKEQCCLWSCIGAHGYPIHIGGGGSWRNGALLGMFVVWSHMEGICRAHSQSNGVLVGYGDNSIATVIYCNRASGL